MKQLRSIILQVVIVLVIALFMAAPVHAHGDEPRLEISVERVNPGGVVEVRGVSFDPEEKIALSLTGASTSIALGEIDADTEGVFLQIVTIPLDLPDGDYEFLAVTDDHKITSPALAVQGPPILDAGGQGMRDEDDPLLAPMPTFPPGAVPIGQAPDESATASVSVSAARTDFYLLSGSLLILGILLFVAQKTKRKK